MKPLKEKVEDRLFKQDQPLQTVHMLCRLKPYYNELTKVHDHDHYQDAACEHHEEHAMHDNYVKDNAVSVVHSNVSSVPNYAYMMIYNDMYEPHAQSVSKTSRNTGRGRAGYGGVQNRVRNANPDKMLLMQDQENGMALDAKQLLFLTCGQDNVVDEDVDGQPVQDLALNVDNVFQADDCDAFNSDVDDASTAQTMFMANLSSADPVNDEAGPSSDSNILSE
nr:retrovirus-related Pol polyprotein from transposon TNT 1-94 [Tanacetum cinerariifolium]